MEESLTVLNHKEGKMNYFFQKRFYIDECLRGSHAHLACFFVLCALSVSLVSCMSAQTKPYETDYLIWAEDAITENKFSSAEYYIKKAEDLGDDKQAVSELRQRVDVARAQFMEKLERMNEGWVKEREELRARRYTSDRNLPAPGTEFRDLLKDGSFGPQMVVIPAGSFLMGDIQNDCVGYVCDNARPVHSVEIEYPFAIGKYEVTVEEFSAFVADSGYVTLAEQKKREGCSVYVRGFYWYRNDAYQAPLDASWRNPYFYRDIQGTEPVTCISWYDAVAYTKWLSEQTGERYRLPTEAEWEYAARGGTKTTYWWGNKASLKYANYHYAGKHTKPVGSYPANPFGIHDTAGNISEWVCSVYSGYAGGDPTKFMLVDEQHTSEICHTKTNPYGGSWESGIARGGSWKSLRLGISSAIRRGRSFESTRYNVGFRVIRPLL